ncbi:hypothetical protein HK096_000610 [Nowakowskiella sp. JEL0078]|nr:hypothetical protein HK096_000610 [Nowakowskiella sp. JEL0078]
MHESYELRPSKSQPQSISPLSEFRNRKTNSPRQSPTNQKHVHFEKLDTINENEHTAIAATSETQKTLALTPEGSNSLRPSKNLEHVNETPQLPQFESPFPLVSPPPMGYITQIPIINQQNLSNQQLLTSLAQNSLLNTPQSNTNQQLLPNQQNLLTQSQIELLQLQQQQIELQRQSQLHQQQILILQHQQQNHYLQQQILQQRQYLQQQQSRLSELSMAQQLPISTNPANANPQMTITEQTRKAKFFISESMNETEDNLLAVSQALQQAKLKSNEQRPDEQFQTIAVQSTPNPPYFPPASQWKTINVQQSPQLSQISQQLNTQSQISSQQLPLQQQPTNSNFEIEQTQLYLSTQNLRQFPLQPQFPSQLTTQLNKQPNLPAQSFKQLSFQQQQIASRSTLQFQNVQPTMSSHNLQQHPLQQQLMSQPQQLQQQQIGYLPIQQLQSQQQTGTQNLPQLQIQQLQQMQKILPLESQQLQAQQQSQIQQLSVQFGQQQLQPRQTHTQIQLPRNQSQVQLQQQQLLLQQQLQLQQQQQQPKAKPPVGPSRRSPIPEPESDSDDDSFDSDSDDFLDDDDDTVYSTQPQAQQQIFQKVDLPSRNNSSTALASSSEGAVGFKRTSSALSMALAAKRLEESPDNRKEIVQRVSPPAVVEQAEPWDVLANTELTDSLRQGVEWDRRMLFGAKLEREPTVEVEVWEDSQIW